MEIQFLNTRVVSNTSYIDVLSVDGQIYTMLMHKIAEPNIYGILKQEDGDTSESIGESIGKKEIE